MEKKEREELKERLLKMVVNEPRLESMPPMTMAEVMVNSMSKPNLEPLLDFISQELDRARKEGVEEGVEVGYQECMDDIWEEARSLRSWTEHDGNVSAADIEAGLQEAYLNIESSRK